jgi:hypothetical protein
MSSVILVLVVVAFAVLLCFLAWQWVRIVLGVFRWLSAASGQGAPSPDSRPIAGLGSGSHPKGAKRPPEGVDDPGEVGYYNRPPRVSFRRSDAPAFLLFGVALKPDFDSFFGGLEAAVAAGGVVLVAVVVVMTVRRFTSF